VSESVSKCPLCQRALSRIDIEKPPYEGDWCASCDTVYYIPEHAVLFGDDE